MRATHGIYDGTLRNAHAIVHIISGNAMRKYKRCDRHPSHSFEDDSLNVDKAFMVLEVGQPLSPDDMIEFSMCFLLDLWVQRHRDEEVLHRIRCLRPTLVSET